ncbi:MAG: TIR domain-containing protein [Ahniella sp.]|nr:TIR domain-containing protein [Ahniella sp.]
MTLSTENAVFLSYASQDTDAVQLMVEALRAAGVNVWFDRLELVGGDAWDRKIRNQISECSLFVPVISSNTQARREGYFRLEWHLAEQRSLLIAKGQPFIVPVSLDGVREGEALVPDAFTAVQWTPLPRTEVPEAFVARIQRLLAKQETSKAPAAAGSTPQTGARIRARSRRSVWRAWAIGALCACALALAVKVMIGSGGDVPNTAQRTPATSTDKASEGNFIAVLPFVSRSADEATAQSNAFFTDGVHEDVLTQLSNIPDLRVISRTSVMQYKDQTATVPQIRAELGVSHILEGSVQRVGSIVRINAQLIDARTDSRMWAQSFEKDVTDVFAIQAEIAKAIAAELKSVLTPEQQERLERAPTENKEALALFINASAMNTFSPEQNKAAITLLERAIKLDPNFTKAFVRLARLYLMRGSREAATVAMGYAQKAVALDPKSAPAHHVLATSTMAMGKLDEARLYFQRATELDANFLSAFKDLSVLEATAGRLDLSFYWANRVMPLAPNVSYSYYHLGVPLLTLDPGGRANS